MISIKISGRSKKLIILWSLLLFPFLCAFAFGNTSLSSKDASYTQPTDPIYVVSGDIIKNFKFEKFMGIDIDSSGSCLGGKVIFQSGPEWQLDKKDIQLLYTQNLGNKRYLYYKLAFKNYFVAFTNVPLGASVQYLNPINEELEVVDFQHNDAYDQEKSDWESSITWNHWDFGDIKNFNSQQNSFSGALECSFDIAPSVLPNIFEDSEGNKCTKQFDYIAVSSVSIFNTSSDVMSNNVPTIVSVTPQPYEAYSDVINNLSPESGRQESLTLVPNIILSDPYALNSFDEGVVLPTKGSSCFATQKDGSPVYDARDEEKSMKDCKFTINIPRISPVVLEYAATLSYTHFQVRWKDQPNIIQSTVSCLANTPFGSVSSLNVGNIGFGAGTGLNPFSSLPVPNLGTLLTSVGGSSGGGGWRPPKIEVPSIRFDYGFDLMTSQLGFGQAEIEKTENPEQRTEVRPIALHVKNRYGKMGVQIVLNLWTQYDIDTKIVTVGSDGMNLGNPSEDYTDIIWGNVVSGTGGGSYTVDTPEQKTFLDYIFEDLFSGLKGAIILVAFIGVGLVCMCVFFKIVFNIFTSGSKKIKIVSEQSNPYHLNLFGKNQSLPSSQTSYYTPSTINYYAQPMQASNISPQDLQPIKSSYVSNIQINNSWKNRLRYFFMKRSGKDVQEESLGEKWTPGDS